MIGEALTQLVNGIPVYMWLFMALVLLVNAGVLWVSVGKDEPRRHTTSARNPGRKAGYGR